MTQNLSWEIAVVSIVVSVGTLLISMLMYQLTKESKRRNYDDERHRAEIEVIRRSLEEQIIRLNERLTATAERWQDVNHLVVSGQKISPDPDVVQAGKEIPRLEFLKRAGITEKDYVVDRRLIFVLIPFHPDFEKLYTHIQSTCQKFGLICMRGDEEHIRGDLLPYILSLMIKARLILAVVDGRNPNVFYELGIAHALGKPVLTLAKSSGSLEDIPIDVRSNRILFYDEGDSLELQLGTELTKALIADR